MRWRRRSPDVVAQARASSQHGRQPSLAASELVGADQHPTQRLNRSGRAAPGSAAWDAAATEVLDRSGLPGTPSHRGVGGPLQGPAPGHTTQALDPAIAGAAADPFRDTTILTRPTLGEQRPPPDPLLTRERAAEVGLYCGALLVLVAVLGIAARLWEQWDGVERLVTTSLAAIALVLGGIWVRAPWGRPASEERLRGVSVMLTTGVVAGGVGSALLFGLGQSSDPVAGVGHALVAVALMTAVNAAVRTPFSETALLGALGWLGWVALPSGVGLWLGLLALGGAWAGLGLRYARGQRTAAIAGAVLALTAAAALAAQPGAWIARAALAVVTGAALGAFRAGRANLWLALGAAAACALAVGTAADALSPAPALLAGGAATMAVSGIALRSARNEAEGEVGAPPA